VRAILATWRRESWIHARSYRLSFFGAALLSALFTLLAGRVLYRTVFGGQVTPAFIEMTGTRDYMTFLLVGLLANSYAFRMLYCVRNVLEEHEMGTLPALRLAGMTSARFQLGCAGFAACYALVELFIIAGAALPWSGASFGMADASGIALAFVAGLPGLLGFSMLLSGLVLVVRNRLVVESFAFTLMALLAGVAFPVSYLPVPLQALGHALPLTWIVGMLRGAVLHGADARALMPEALALLGIGIVHGALGIFVLRRAVRDALAVAA